MGTLYALKSASFVKYKSLLQQGQNKPTMTKFTEVGRKTQFHTNRLMMLLCDYCNTQNFFAATADIIDVLLHVLSINSFGLSRKYTSIPISGSSSMYDPSFVFVSKANDSINPVIRQIANCFTLHRPHFTDSFGPYVLILQNIMGSSDGDACIWLAVATATHNLAERYVGWRSSFVLHFLICASGASVCAMSPDDYYTSYEEEFYDLHRMASILNLLSVIYLIDEESSAKARSAWLLASILVRGALAQDISLGETLVKKYVSLLDKLSQDLFFERSERFDSDGGPNLKQLIHQLLTVKDDRTPTDCFVFTYNAECSSQHSHEDIEYQYGNNSKGLAVMQAMLIAAGVLSGMIESTIDRDHLKVLDFSMCISRLHTFAITSSYLKNRRAHQDCMFGDVHNKHNRVTVVYCEKIDYFVSCANMDDFGSAKLPHNIMLENGVYERTTTISLVMLSIGTIILLGSISLIFLSQAKVIQLTFDPTSLAAWLSGLYAALAVLVQNTWIEDWTWYDMLRNRRLLRIVGSTTKSNLGINTFLKYLQIRIATCDQFMTEILTSEHTSALSHYANGKTTISSGPTVNMLLLSGRPVCYCFEDQTTYLPFRPLTLGGTGHQIITKWTALHDKDSTLDASGGLTCLTSKELRLSYGLTPVNGTLPQLGFP